VRDFFICEREMKKENLTPKEKKAEPLSIRLGNEERNSSKNIYLDSASDPFHEDNELIEFYKTIEELTNQKLDIANLSKAFNGVMQVFFRSMIFSSVTSLIKYLIQKEYYCIKQTLLLSQDKNIVGTLLTFNVSDNKYELNILEVKRKIDEIIMISEMTTNFYQAIDKNRKHKQPRLKANDVSLLAYLITIDFYLKDNSLSVRKVCLKVYDKLYSNGYMKQFSEFDSYKQSFLDWCSNEQNQNKYPKIKEFLAEKKERIAARKNQKNVKLEQTL
jgi:hypothetical protein